MGKQKLNSVDVKLIKHLHSHRKFNQCQITRILDNKVSRCQVNRIVLGFRWIEVEIPDIDYGEELYYRFIRKGKLVDEI